MKLFLSVVLRPLHQLIRLIRAVIGDVVWQPPQWLRRVRSKGAKSLAWLGSTILVVMILAGIGLWQWHVYAHLPKPRMVNWIVNMGDFPEPSDDDQTQDLTLHFDSSVARLDLIGKDVSKQVTLTPNLSGKWSWAEGNQLQFEPDKPWPAATEFSLKLAPELFTRHARIDGLKKTFHTAPFTVAITDSLFYVNPKDPAVKQITATLTFSHPVNRASLEQKLSLAMESGPNVFDNAPKDTGRCTFTYAKRDRVVYIRSVNITVPKESGHAILIVPASVRTTAGAAALENLAQSDVLVPSSSDLFHIASAEAKIVTNTQDEPEQALILTTSVGVKPELLVAATHAWVLPKWKKHVDAVTGHVWYGDWSSPAQVDADVLAQSTAMTLVPVPIEQEYATLHSFKMKVPENVDVYVQVDKGLASVGGFVLGDKFGSVTKVAPYPREVKIMHDGSLLALSGERKLSILSRGVEQIEYRLQRVTPASINHLVSQSEGSFQSPIFNNYNFNETNITEQAIRRQALAATDTSKNDYSALDFSEFVDGSKANDGKLGLFILRVLARKPGEQGNFYQQGGGEIDFRDPGERYDILSDRRLILVTDLGLLIKDNADGTHDVFVQSIKSGDPVADAQIDVLGKNGIPVVSVKTDGSGHASIPSLRDFKREKTPVAYVARRGSDVSFLPFGRQDRELNFSRFDTAGISGQAAHDLTAFVFTDRGIYRPGDEARLGVIVKQRDWHGKLDGIPLRLDVIDPRGTVVQSRPMRLNANGLLEGKFSTRETSHTGTYRVNCVLIKTDGDEILLGSQSLKVAEFLPDRLKIKATLSSGTIGGWVNGKDLKGLVSLANLYGTASIGHRVTGKVTLNPSQFCFELYPDYTFIDPYLNPHAARSSHEQDLPEQTTNDSGEASFDLAMPNLDPSAYQLSFLAEGFEKEGGRSVTAGTQVLVSPRAWLVGVKTDGDFSYVHLNSARVANFLAVDSHLQSVSVEHLKLKLIERRFVSVLVQKPNGNYAYESVLKENSAGEEEIAIPEKGLAWPLKTTQPGDFAARLYDDHGDLVADVRFAVAGSGNVSRSLEKNAELSAKLSKPEYLPGEEVEVEITAPYTGAGLITIERDKVYAQTWFQAKTTTTIQKITLPKDFEGNGYINVAFVRALDSREIYMSPLSYAVLPFKVNQEARHTHINIDVPKVARPGEPLAMKISASRPTQAVVYAVDEGILQVARYTLPDPLGYFFRKQALEVGTRQTVDLILPEYSIVKEVSAAGGDADEDALAHHLNPFKPKHDAPVAYWSGIVDIGPEAKTFTYPVPDYYAGTLRVMVVANTADAVGSEEKKMQVRGPFIISPNVPTFVAPGDVFDVSVTVANNVEGSGPNAAVNLDLQTTDGLEVIEKPALTAVIAEGRDAALHWKLRAKDHLGNADITVAASLGDKKTSLASHLSVRPPVPYLTTLTSGYFKENEKRVPSTRKLYPQFYKGSAMISASPQGLTQGLGEYLKNYSYGCTEQLISKAFPTLVSDETMEQGLPRAEVATHLEEVLDVAASRQNDEGAFGLWTAQPDLHFDLPSVHIMHFMTEAKDQGYDMPSDMVKRGLDHLQQDANGTPTNFREARNQAYAIYILARNGQVMTNALEHNHHWFEQNAKDNWSDDVAAVYEAGAYALLKNQDQADRLIRKFQLQNGTHRLQQEEVDYDDDLGRAAQYIYVLAHQFPERLKMLSGDDLMTLAFPIIQEDYNTISSSEAILALDAYNRALKTTFEQSAPEIDEITGDKTRKLDLPTGLYPKADFSRLAATLVFRKTSPGGGLSRGVFYQMTQSGFELTTVTKPISEGIEVSREYLNKAGKPVTTAKLGENLTVVVRVRSTDNQNLENVAVQDLLPGGFEIVEESVHTGTCTGWSGFDYTEVREDRLLAYGSVSGADTEIRYEIKATNRGTYAIPPAQAEAMYHLKIRARGVSGTLTVAD